MNTMAVTLPEGLVEYLDDRVRSGKATDPSQVIQKALRVLQAVEKRRSAFDAAVQEGLDALETGDFEEVQDLELWFAEQRNSWRA